MGKENTIHIHNEVLYSYKKIEIMSFQEDVGTRDLHVE
jgi:hypothetical protein